MISVAFITSRALFGIKMDYFLVECSGNGCIEASSSGDNNRLHIIRINATHHLTTESTLRGVIWE